MENGDGPGKCPVRIAPRVFLCLVFSYLTRVESHTMTCTKTENGLLFSKDGKDVLVEDVSHPHFAKHVVASFGLADIEVRLDDLYDALHEHAISNNDLDSCRVAIENTWKAIKGEDDTFTNDGFGWSELPARHVDDRYEDDGA